ncbi:NAD(P)H-dependent flavin oxidoreductase [Saccharopolyspora elongata]|uniref:Nitronate monooxygenase n=1 Tax=Saccharopolyspora elongata TaxID=2530387 RepID=A0A4R4YBC7_9PSEU|nr:nitronate monooxygenase [Saccharopolyspora elongata]TDD41350.1 nitronate monooxygenase [Saccharopolyspora elongata]
MAVPTRFTEQLGVEHPVVLAPMDYVADARLARAVSRAGGLGLLGGGYGDRDWLLRELGGLDLAAEGVGCGFITWSLASQPHLLDIVLERQPKAVFLSFGDPAPFVERIHAAGVPVICQVGNLEHARHALEVGADVLVAQGGEGGGHGVGTRSTLTLVPEIADLIVDRGSDALLLAAGGIADARGVAAVLALGADGAVVGTRFLVSEEAAISAEAQARALLLSGDDTVRQSVYDIVRGKDWPAVYSGRVLNNEFVAQWHGREGALTEQIGEVRALFTTAVEVRDFDTANLIVGEAVGLIRSVESVESIVRSLTRFTSGRVAEVRS